MQAFSKLSAWMMLALLAAVAAHAQEPVRSAPPKQAQSQAATQFLRAVLRADYVAAYRQLAPEVRRTVGFAQFEASARPLWKSGQKHRSAIELYKLGLRLGDGGASRLFYAFSFAADSAVKPPPVLLEVTFRDTAARTVLGFGLRPAAPAKPLRPASQAAKR
ncbi:hypothetical protein [Hymenobacter ruricola]|uniref:DUF3887 domain-containing protein n=1 Tax=Hymenobacter ruricola TaxID=2791023 RepID=A0ABS0HZ21_9BACT|nr:hypothetical protein [Hymenobacter ruricola]MBF9219554.1 hypothetical protein [Hymenobacter ruricola]